MIAVGWRFDALDVIGFVRAKTSTRARYLVAKAIKEAGFTPSIGAAFPEIKIRRDARADDAPIMYGKPDGLVPNTWSPP